MKNLSLVITICHHLASLMMPNDDPLDRFFYPILTLLIDSYNDLYNNVVQCMCDQQRLRSACAYAQSDQSFCLSLEYSISVKLLTKHHLEFLSLKGGCSGSSESTLVKISHYLKLHVVDHYVVCLSFPV